MAKYFTQFDESTQTIGTDLTGWTVEVGGTPTRAPAYGATTTVPVKRRYLALTTQTAGTNTMLSWDAIDADANRDKFDLLTCCILPLTTVDDNVALFARQSGGINNVYFGILTLAGGLSIYKVVAGVGTTVASAAFTVDPAKSYFLRFNGNGTALKLRAWDAALGMAAEPTTWNISTTDSSLTAAGNVGVQCFDSSGTGEVAAFNFLAVGTNGDTAVCPRTNTEYTAWLDSQSAIRCVLAEMSATGYDSGGSPYTKTVNVYLSNHGYTSQQQDTPSLRHYDNYIQQIPTFTREMSTALSGQATTGFGDLIISNPVETIASGGVRDNWLRMAWNRSTAKVYLGDPSWPKHDFRQVIYGRVGMPTSPAPQSLAFKLADLSDALNVNISPTLIGGSSGYANQFEPVLYGAVSGHIEPPLIDSAALTYQIHKGGISIVDTATGYDENIRAYDNYVHIGSDAIVLSSVDTGTDTMTATAPHGLAAGWRVIFYSANTPPTGISVGVTYYVIAAGLTTTAFRVSTTLGGSAVNITATFPGPGAPRCNGYGYYFDTANGTMTLIGQPAGRVTVAGANVTATGTEYNPADIYEAIAFTDAGLSLNNKDASTFTTLRSAMTSDGIVAGFWLDTTRHTAAEAAQRLAVGTFTWYGITGDGLMQVGRLGLPAATAVMSFTESDVVRGSLRLVDVIRPIDFSAAEVTHAPWFLTSGPLQVADAYAIQGKKYLAAYSYGAAGTPLDDHPDRFDSNKTASIDLLISDALGSTASSGGVNQQTALVTLYKHKLGIFEFTTRLSASQLNIGDTISLTHPRYHWKQWTGADDASPDNTATIDSRLAVVIGIATDVAKGTTKIKCFRRIPGYYPTTDLN